MLGSLQRYAEHALAPAQRLRGVQLLHSFALMRREDALELESHAALAACGCVLAYQSHLRRQAYNLACNPALLTSAPPRRLIHMSDEEFAAGTAVERVQIEEQARMKGYIELLREKYEDVVRAQSSDSILKCRNCGSSDVTFSQKQTRSADESSTIFCSCQACKKRWRLS